MYSKLKKIVLSSIIVAALAINTKIYAAVSIVPSKDGTGKDCMVNTTISNSFLLCRGMMEAGETLEGTTVDPHLATNTDWGAVSYLSNSTYGTNTEGKDTGIQVNIEGVKYYSTNGNETGVMNWGANPNKDLVFQTAALIEAYNEDSKAKENVKELYNNRNTKYVDNIDTQNMTKDNTKGMAMKELDNSYPTGGINVRTDINGPVSIRKKLFYFFVGQSNYYGYFSASGAGYSHTTFRPVIWNN